MKAALFLFAGAAIAGWGGALPEAGADVVRRAMYLNSGGETVSAYVFQADRKFRRSYCRGRDYARGISRCAAPRYFGSSYTYPVYPVYSSYAYPPYPVFRGYGGYYSIQRGYRSCAGGFYGHGAFSTGSLRVHFGF